MKRPCLSSDASSLHMDSVSCTRGCAWMSRSVTWKCHITSTFLGFQEGQNVFWLTRHVCLMPFCFLIRPDVLLFFFLFGLLECDFSRSWALLNVAFQRCRALRVEKWGTLNDGVSRPRGPDGETTGQQMVTDSSTVECFRCTVSISIIPRPPSRLHEHLRFDPSGLFPAAPLPWRDGGSPRCDWDTTATIYNIVHKSSLCECTFDKSLFIYM